MKFLRKIFLSLLLAVGVSGCFKTKEIIALNPDGSGKIYYQVTHGDTGSAMAANFGDSTAKPTPPEKRVKKKVSEILKTSKGIDAWKDVSCQVAGNGEITFKGTAYFPDYSEVKIGGNFSSTIHPVFKAVDSGMELLWSRSSQDKQNPPAEEMKMDAEALDEAVQEAREGFQESVMMMRGVLTGLRNETYYMLPGTIDAVNNFTQVKKNVVKLVVDGNKLLSVMNAYMKDDQAVREAVLAGRDPVKDGPDESYFNKMMFGDEGPVSAKVGGELTPIFDYAAESSAAAAAFPEMCKALGIEMPKQLELAPVQEGAAAGVIHGEPFKVEKAYIQNGILHLRQGEKFFADQELMIFLFLKEGETVSGKTYEVPSASGFGSPHVHMKYKVPEKSLPETKMFTSKYVMTLSFEEQAESSIAGKISIALPDDMESRVSGNFVAEIK